MLGVFFMMAFAPVSFTVLPLPLAMLFTFGYVPFAVARDLWYDSQYSKRLRK